MKKYHKLHLLFSTIIVSLASIFSLQAQTDKTTCTNNTIAANKEYEAGNFKKSIELLNPCVASLDKKEVFVAHRLLALCHMYLNEEDKTHEEVVNLLKSKPDYKDFPYFDPMEFTKLLSKYGVWPQLELGVKAGVNINSVRAIKNYSVTGSEAEFLPGVGYQAGMVSEYYLLKNVSLNLEFMYEGLSYTRTASNVSGWNQEYNEKLNYFTIPLAGRYYFFTHKDLLIAAELGFQTQLLNATQSNIILTNSSTSESIQNTAEQSGQRNKQLFYGLAGLVGKYKLGGGTLSANVRFAYGFSNVVNSEARYQNLEFIMANQYVDSDIAFNPLYISLGYQFPLPNFYKVKRTQK